MLFKFDENLHPDAAEIFAEAGHDALTVYDQGLRGHGDDDVAEVCRREGRAARHARPRLRRRADLPARRLSGHHRSPGRQSEPGGGPYASWAESCPCSTANRSPGISGSWTTSGAFPGCRHWDNPLRWRPIEDDGGCRHRIPDRSDRQASGGPAGSSSGATGNGVRSRASRFRRKSIGRTWTWEGWSSSPAGAS